MTIEKLESKEAVVIAAKLFDILNNAALCLMISLGHRTQLFDVMAELPPATSEAIASAAKLNERYVREWLGAMVMGRIIEYDRSHQTYSLPPEYAAFLTRKATPNNMAVTMQFIPVLAQVEDLILTCFQQGGGLAYSAYPRFHEVMAEDSTQSLETRLEQAILPLVPGLIDKLTQGIQVLDVGCGLGGILIKMALQFPRSQFLGVDFSEQVIANATSCVQQLGLTNINFEVRDAAQLNIIEQFDLITAFDAIHDQAQPDRVLHHIYQALRNGGTFLMIDIRASREVHQNLNHPAGTFLYTISCLHCTSVSLANNGAGLGTVWGEETAQEMLKTVGFTEITVKQIDGNPVNNIYIADKA